jgi:hypothetical protein
MTGTDMTGTDMTGTGMTGAIGPLDEFPVHQLPLPIGWVGSSDRNFYDRCYFNAHDRSGELFLITGLGYYPNLGVKDAFALLRRAGEPGGRSPGGGEQTAVHLSDAIDADRMNQSVGGYRIEVTEPLRRLRLVLEETEGIAFDLAWEGSFDVIREQPHILRTGNRITLDAQRFAQVGTWSGTLLIDGEEIAVTPDTWVGTRDRSWGIRPVGESEPAGRPADPPMEGFWWLYVPLRFDDFAVVVIIQEEPDGFRTANDAVRVWADGRLEQLGWPRVDITYAPGTRQPTRAVLRCTSAAGKEVTIEVEPLLAAALHVGAGYPPDSDWGHGQWKGAGFAERIRYSLDDRAVAGRIPWGVVDHAARARCHGDGCDGAEGYGLFEHASLGRHDPSGFAGWESVAP